MHTRETPKNQDVEMEQIPLPRKGSEVSRGPRDVTKMSKHIENRYVETILSKVEARVKSPRCQNGANVST